MSIKNIRSCFCREIEKSFFCTQKSTGTPCTRIIHVPIKFHEAFVTMTIKGESTAQRYYFNFFSLLLNVPSALVEVVSFVKVNAANGNDFLDNPFCKYGPITMQL